MKQKLIGRTIYVDGRRIEIMAEYEEYLDYLVQRLKNDAQQTDGRVSFKHLERARYTGD